MRVPEANERHLTVVLVDEPGDEAEPTASGETTLDAVLQASVDLSRPYAEQKEQMLQRFQQAYLQRLLAHTGGNQSLASRLSGIERSYLSKLVRRAR